jgi:lipopolysaccharide transport system ATP-binding protein
MGFHPDFSGRQNVVIAGQLQGLSVEEIASLMPQIEGFAEIGAYIDQPVRVYSSGMQMRLAFSVATCVRPDILIVDEALAVGDVFFQQKCFDRIAEFTRAGTTLLFVSHSAVTILNTCTRCLLLRHGELAFDGSPKEAIDLYQSDLLQGTKGPTTPGLMASTSPRLPNGDSATELDTVVDLATTDCIGGGTGSVVTPLAQCLAVRFTSMQGVPLHVAVSDQRVRLNVVFRFLQDCDDPHVGFKIRNRFGAVLFETNSYCMKRQLGAVAANATLAVEFAFVLNLFAGEYTVTVGLASGGYGEGSFEEILSHLHDVTAIAVVPNPDAITWAGQVNLDPSLRFKVSMSTQTLPSPAPQ